MEKLIELLNEYNEGGNWRDENFDANKLLVISKKYGFIKWLVESDKINTRNLNLQVFKSMFSNDGTVEVSYEELILMLLAISDGPIEFLIDLLK